MTTGAPEVVVAVIDSGILPHADLALRTLPGYDFIVSPSTANDGDERDPDPSDPGDWIDAADLAGSFAGQDCEVARSSWHGTAVAGAIAANGNNGRYAAGMDWSARILPLRVLGKCGGDDFDIADVLAWAGGLPVTGVPDNPNPAHVVNLSLGSGGACPKYFQNVVDLVFAEGLHARDRRVGGQPGQHRRAHPVRLRGRDLGDGDQRRRLARGYANYGARIDIAAPGGNAPRPAAPISLRSPTGAARSPRTTPSRTTRARASRRRLSAARRRSCSRSRRSSRRRRCATSSRPG